MAVDVRVTRVMGRLVPADKVSADELADLPAGVVLRCQITRPRNPRHHAKYWALISAIFPHQKAYPTRNQLHEQLKKAVGFTVETVNLMTGEIEYEADSMAWDNLDQKGFEEVYERIVEVILTRVLPGVGRRDLDAQVMDILEGRKAA
jgi:hypothetical protein